MFNDFLKFLKGTNQEIFIEAEVVQVLEKLGAFL